MNKASSPERPIRDGRDPAIWGLSDKDTAEIPVVRSPRNGPWLLLAGVLGSIVLLIAAVLLGAHLQRASPSPEGSGQPAATSASEGSEPGEPRAVTSEPGQEDSSTLESSESTTTTAAETGQGGDGEARSVRYEVRVTGGSADVEYETGDGEVVDEVGSGWSSTQELPAGVAPSITVRGQGTGRVICRIVIDGDVVADRSAEGEEAVAQCSA